MPFARSIAALALIAAPASLAAEDAPAPGVASLEAVAATIPEREFYPEGYYDTLVAAEADMAELMQDEGLHDDGYAGSVSLSGCFGEEVADGPSGESYEVLARQVAYARFQLVRLGFGRATWEDALAKFERERLAAIAAERAGEPVAYEEMETVYGLQEVAPTEAAYIRLADTINAAQGDDDEGLSIYRGAVECDASNASPTTIVTAPSGGRVWLISAFAFRVCTRRLPDPWDKLECRWNEVETGSEQWLGGRYVYDVEWPDGTSRRGTREIGLTPAERTLFRKP